MEARLIVEDPAGRPARRAIRELVDELVEELRPVASRLGTERELQEVLYIAEHGSSTARQRSLVEAGGTLLDVVNQLADELADDCRPAT